MFSWLFGEKSDVSADEGPRDLPEPDPALFERANWRPADEAGSSVQRSVQRSVQLSAPGSSGRGAGGSSSSGSCLFDRYGGGTVRTASRLEGIGANGTTLSARLRTSGIMRLMCYVNTDDRGSPAAFVPVPESMRTLKDVLAVIQRVMKLDKRFLYARQLFLPDGEVATSADTYVPEPPYSTYRLCVPAICVLYAPEAQGSLPRGATHCTYAVRVPASAVPYAYHVPWHPRS